MRAFPDAGLLPDPQRVYSKASLRSCLLPGDPYAPETHNTCRLLATRWTLFQNFEVETKFVSLQKATPIKKQEYPDN
ncbi:MAG: hypothetical protein DMF04_11165 [Verrucomicrobia bacterium]|nr:MAG: hypothetical protein DMF04_11165 [Verrucomicrobiota bacterium]